MNTRDFYPFTHKWLVLTDGDKNLAVLKVEFGCSSYSGHFCGYCVIPKTDIPKEWHGDYDADGLQYLRIHGGITFCETTDELVVFGFDCAHSGDEEREDLKDPQNILRLASEMRRMILEYAQKVEEWRKATPERRCEILDTINEGSKEDVGFGALIDLTFGGAEKLRGDSS